MRSIIALSMFICIAIPSVTLAKFISKTSASTVCPSSTLCSWSGSVWENYVDQEFIECSSDKTTEARIDVTSGCLYTGVEEYNHFGYTTTYNFRAIAAAKTQRGKTLWWADQRPQYTAKIIRWHDMAADYSYAGIHIFGRYQDENNLYVASWRYDGNMTIKKKINGVYTTLANRYYGTPQLDTPYTLALISNNDTLQFIVNDQLMLSATDTDLHSGTVGIRTDYVDIQFDDWMNN
ncbi:MAG: hypothetical protein HYV32_03675 [Candidatus Kerfeldbacteria bacterium]|nr:hypothetical protein [Candidatus Kerfeldbacteria bacterium]